jgi:hypothetical protein
MQTIAQHCDRAILLEDGLVDRDGDPGGVARRYFALNFPDNRHVGVPEEAGVEDAESRVRMAGMTLHHTDGRNSGSFEQGQRIRIEVPLEIVEPLESGLLGLQIVNADGLLLFAPRPVPLGNRRLEPGERVRVRAEISNPLAAGHYFINAAVTQGAEERRPVAFRKNAADFVVFGTRPFAGLVELDYEAENIEDGSDTP